MVDIYAICHGFKCLDWGTGVFENEIGSSVNTVILKNLESWILCFKFYSELTILGVFWRFSVSTNPVLKLNHFCDEAIPFNRYRKRWIIKCVPRPPCSLSSHLRKSLSTCEYGELGTDFRACCAIHARNVQSNLSLTNNKLDVLEYWFFSFVNIKNLRLRFWVAK